MPRGSKPGNAAAKAAQDTTTRKASGGAMMDAAGLLKTAQDEVKNLSPLEIATLPRIALDRVGPHPLNPEARVDPTDPELLDLVSSIESVGVFTAPLVVTRAAIITHEPTMAALIPEKHEVIIIDGTRRWAASNMAAGVTDMPYVLREELADPAIAAVIFLASNIFSKRLTPIQEARGYLRLQNYLKVNQTALAAAVGVSQAHISKSMQLLKLPEIVQDAVDRGEVSAHSARQLLTLKNPEAQITAYQDAIAALGEEPGKLRQEDTAEPLRAAIARSAARAEKKAAAEQARDALSKGEIAEIDPKELFGADVWKHVLRDTEVDEVKEAGELAGATISDSGRITYYSTTPAPRHRPGSPTGTDEDTAQDYSNGITEGGDSEGGATDNEYSNGISADDSVSSLHDPADPDAIDQALRAAKAAHEDRLSAMRRLAAKLPATSTVLDVVADAVLAAQWIDFEDAAEFADGTGIDLSAKGIESILTNGGRADAHKSAFIAALGALEAEAARTHYATNGPWPIPVQRHVRRLAALGQHTLTDYDRAHLSETE